MAARRNHRRRRNRGLLGPLFRILFVLALVVALTFGVTVFFQIETVKVEGNVRYTPEDVISASGLQVGDNLYRFNKNHISTQILQSLPYIEGVSINRRPPSTIIITVSEWDAVAKVIPGVPGETGGDQTADADGSSSADASASGSSSGDSSSGEVPLEYTQIPWLISSGCKLLEPAPEGNPAVPITGITPVMARAGALVQVAPEEENKLNALKNLLGELEKRGELGNLRTIDLGDTEVVVTWMDRFEVHFALNADFEYKLRYLAASIQEVENLRGEGITGILDLTQENGPTVYSPFPQQ